jgi:DNA mismatch repair protein MutL
VKDFAKPVKAGLSVRELLESLPGQLAGNDFPELVQRVVAAVQADKPVLLGMGAHVIKVGLNPILIDLMRKGVISALALNGACIIHDTEIAMVGRTSEEVADVLGAGLRADLVAVSGKNSAADVSGWIGAPRITRSTNRGIYLFVNGRFVRDRLLQHAIFSGYSGRLVKGQYPVAVIRIRLPYNEVDVNVHPTKHEVRFAHQKQIHNAVADAVARSLAETQKSRWYGDSSYDPQRPAPFKAAETPPSYPERPRLQKSPGLTPPPTIIASESEQPGDFQAETSLLEKEILPPQQGVDQIPKTSFRESAPIKSPPEKDSAAPSSSTGKAVQNSIWEKRRFADLRVIGQFHDTYLICEGEEGLLLIDQHAAHERIAYEQLKKNARRQKQSSQRLLLPETIELGFREAQILTRMIPELKQLGLEIDPFGGATFVVTAVPDLLSRKQMAPMIQELVEKIADVGIGEGLETVLDQCFMVMACHSSIRANQALSPQQTRALLEQLDRCDHPSHCPHGRPTWIQWSVKAVEKAFNRIV